ncbi:hypothetical protein [Brevibacillus brevis]|nr:hypothetical protein [Brevibacillus brevis]PSJ67510.1 hypothetical protein C7J99_19660 [Brevibacillus brevis]RED32815.1 hypothetical protein DES34_103127 [Brevibacillus brevis]GEC92837.1 hypothetical protein BBR01nite_51680 [Brevibacillus brevis]VEF90488.1 Uncharacterised protein [Brevibacillus brevis]
MNRIILFLLLFLTGCSQITVEEDFKNYAQTVTGYQQEIANKMNELQKEKITDFQQFSKEQFLPIVKEFVDKTSTLQPQTKEVAEIHEKYIEAVGLNYDVLSSISNLDGQTTDTSKQEELLKKLEKSQQLASEWKNSMDNLSKQYNVVLPDINLDVGNAIFRLP